MMTAPAKLEAVIEFVTTASREKVGFEHVETLGKETAVLRHKGTSPNL